MIEHDPRRADGAGELRAALSAELPNGEPCVAYQTLHRVLAEGNFVLCASEGADEGVHSALYDLFRVADDTIVEHWDSIEPIPPRSEWNNDNGKF